MRVEILIDSSMSPKGRRMLEAMAQTSPLPVISSATYRGAGDLLMMYGNGHPVRRKWWLQHRQSGRPCVAWDLGYWDKDQGAMRMTVNDDHTHRLIRSEPGARWDARGVELRDDAGDGPALVIGLGDKSCKALGIRPGSWERAAIDRLRGEGRQVAFRPKKPGRVMPGVPSATGTIEEALAGKSFVVCRHSNVAVDACIAGVPVRCEDGAALALYRHGERPSKERRLEFLRSLAWWNWKPSEAQEAWNYLISRLS